MLPPRSLPCCLDMVNPTVSFDSAVDGEPLGCISFELFADKVPKTAENFHAQGTGEKGFGYKVSCFHRIIPGFMCQTSHAIMVLVASPSMARDFMMRISSWKHTGPGTLSMVNAGPNTNGSVFHLHCQDWVVGWQVCSLWQGERGHEYCGSHGVLWIQEWQDQQDHHCWLWKNLINLTCVLPSHQTIPSVVQESTPYPYLLEISYNLCAFATVLQVPYFPYSPPSLAGLQS